MTIVMMIKTNQTVSKSAFKSKALEYFRAVEKSHKPLIITDHGKPVLKVVPFSEDSAEILRELRGSVLEYVDPTEPVADSDWEALE
jgi:prevent-host-death family protein